MVSNIGYSKNNGCRGAGNDFTSSILTKFQGKHSFVSQRHLYLEFTMNQI